MENAPIASPPHNLPAAATTFVGREREVAEVGRQLNAARLVTLTGPGGGGKTRLTLAVAARVLPGFADGVWWCDLASVSDPAFVAPSVAATLRMPANPQRPALETLTETLQDKRLLLVLDNCEHLLSACATLIAAVLGACPEVRVMATSLQALGLPEEHAYPVPPLGLPERDALASESDAVRLFAERAAQALPNFALTPANLSLVTAICQRLDGLPLPIELAAARVKLLTLEQIAERLDDAFRLLTRGQAAAVPRQQTLRATMDWAYQLLSEAERALLRRLSVFAGAFTVEMAEAISGAGVSEPGVIDLLADLADKSLVTLLPRAPDEAARFRLLETVRQYCREKLEAAGETAETRARHLEWFAAFAQRLGAKLAGPEAAPSLAQLDQQLDNLRLALQWVRTSRAVEPGLALASAIWIYWQSRGYLAEGRGWLEELLALADGTPNPPPPLLRGRALYAAAALAFRHSDFARAATLAEASVEAARVGDNAAQMGVPLSLLAILATEAGDYERAAKMHAEALALYRGLGDAPRTSNTLINLGIVARRQGDYGRALDYYAEALTLRRQMGDRAGAAVALSNVGEIAVLQGRLAQAMAVLEEARLLYGELGSKAGVVAVLNNLGVAARYQSQPAQARAYLDEAAALCREMGDQVRLALVWINQGDLARDAGDLAQAQSLYADALAHLPAEGDPASRALALHSLGLVAASRGDEAGALEQHRESLTLYRATNFPLGMVEAVEALAGMVARQGEARRAARWLAATGARRLIMGVPVSPVEAERHAQTMASVRAALGTGMFKTAQAEGQALTLEQAAEEAADIGLEAKTASVEQALARPEWRAYALGNARVEKNGHTIGDADWTYTKAKELFFYLLTHPARTKAEIGLDLWPDATPAQLRSTFHRSLHHLRRALGQPEAVVFEGDSYYLDRSRPHWSDVEEFDAHLAESRRALQSGATPAARATAAEQLEAALALYQGDFLADLEAEEWATFPREELRRRRLEAQLALGGLHFADARYAQAAAVYRQMIAQDPYLEAAQRELMRCLARLGETGLAVRQYQALSQLLRDELRAQPAPETTLLFERLRRGDDV